MSEIITTIPPAKSLLKGLRAIGYSFSTAVADIIDNSITAEASEVKIYFDPLDDTPYFLIFDNGYGMNRSELNNAMLFGSNREDKVDCEEDLGRFGLGLKSASLSQCKKFTVISKKYGKMNAMSYDIDRICVTNSWDLEILNEEEYLNLPYVKELSKIDSGTIVLWNKFDKLESESGSNFEYTFRQYVADMKLHLEKVFHRFYNNVKIFINEKRIDKIDPFLTSSVKSQHGRVQEIHIEGYNRFITVQPHTLPYANKLTEEEKALLGNPKSIYDEQGFYIYRNKRLIYWGSWMHMGYKSELNKLARVQVDIPSDFDEMWMLDVKKSSAKIPAIIKQEIISSIDSSVKTSTKVIRYRGQNEAKGDCPIWNRIKDREGYVKYQINRNNPLINVLSNLIGKEEKKLLENLLSQIEFYIPKARIQNDNADAINIINGDSNLLDENELVKQVTDILSKVPDYLRESVLDTILKTEGYLSIKHKRKEILECLI